MANMWLMGDELMGEGNVKAVLLRLATSRKVECSISDGVFGIVLWYKKFRPHYVLGVDSASNRKE